MRSAALWSKHKYYWGLTVRGHVEKHKVTNSKLLIFSAADNPRPNRRNSALRTCSLRLQLRASVRSMRAFYFHADRGADSEVLDPNRWSPQSWVCRGASIERQVDTDKPRKHETLPEQTFKINLYWLTVYLEGSCLTLNNKQLFLLPSLTSCVFHLIDS